MNPEEKKDKLSEIIEQNYSALIRFIRRKWKGEDSADDVLNDVVEKIYRLPDITVPLDYLTSYLYRSISNRIIDLLRKKDHPEDSLNKETAEGSSLMEILEDNRYRPDKQLEMIELKDSLNKALSRLSEAERAVVVESEIHRVPFRLLAEEWGIPIGTLLSRKQRALKKIKKYLEKEK